MKNILKKTQAFTLIEIIVVVIIVGVLASLGLMKYQKVVMQAREREAINQLRSIHTASAVYYSRARQYLPGTNLGVAAINQQLGLNIIPNGMFYWYHRDNLVPNAFEVEADWLDPATGSSIFEVHVTQAPLDSSNPCCCVGLKACPTLAACGPGIC